jgi:proteasome assembly chaperone (PAC2) family protein
MKNKSGKNKFKILFLKYIVFMYKEHDYIMEFVNVEDPDVKKPIVIAAMQDMGNVGTIAIEFINKSLKSILFRYVSSYYPNYVLDKGGYIDFEQERWEYRYTKDTIIFGGGVGQPQTNKELYELCQDVIDIAKTHSAQLIYTLGAFHTSRKLGKQPKTFVTTTSPELTEQVKKLRIETTPQSSLITGFNGLILGFAKLNNIQGIGLYSEINDPQIPQYHSAKSVLQLLERLTYHKFGGFEELDIMAEAVDDEIRKRTKSDQSWD